MDRKGEDEGKWKRTYRLSVDESRETEFVSERTNRSLIILPSRIHIPIWVCLFRNKDEPDSWVFVDMILDSGADFSRLPNPSDPNAPSGIDKSWTAASRGQQRSLDSGAKSDLVEVVYRLAGFNDNVFNGVFGFRRAPKAPKNDREFASRAKRNNLSSDKTTSTPGRLALVDLARHFFVEIHPDKTSLFGATLTLLPKRRKNEN